MVTVQPLPYSQSVVRLPGRGTEHPDLYEATNHPLRGNVRGRTFVFYQDTSRKGMAKTFKIEEALCIPGRTAADAKEKGKLDYHCQFCSHNIYTHQVSWNSSTETTCSLAARMIHRTPKMTLFNAGFSESKSEFILYTVTALMIV